MASTRKHVGNPLSAVRHEIKTLTSAHAATPNACFFTLGARLARFTGNETYAMYADKTWRWLSKVKFLDEKKWQVYLGALVENNCGNVTKEVYTVDLAWLTVGAAFMYNYVSLNPTSRRQARF